MNDRNLRPRSVFILQLVLCPAIASRSRPLPYFVLTRLYVNMQGHESLDRCFAAAEEAGGLGDVGGR